MVAPRPVAISGQPIGTIRHLRYLIIIVFGKEEVSRSSDAVSCAEDALWILVLAHGRLCRNEASLPNSAD